jgi:AraC-like DNA-binding protein
MTPNVPLSSKRHLIDRDGYMLSASRQPRYTFNWHMHDCAMLLWARAGALDSAWESEGARQRGRFARGQALLLPARVAHSTRSDSARQQHGELYLAPELLRDCGANGALQLDGAAQAMLDALWMPAMSPRALPALVRALIEQLNRSRPGPVSSGPPLSLGALWVQGLVQALEDGRPLPSVSVSALTLGVSPRSLQRACLQEYGLSPVALRRRLLARAARARLQAGESLARVSAELGFANSGHLGRLLRQVPLSA